MSFGGKRHLDSDDLFSDTRMSFGDHLDDLRLHLWRAVAGFLIALVIGFFIGRPLLRFISAPVKSELKKYWDKYYDKKHREIVQAIREGKLGGGMPFQTTILLDSRLLDERYGVKAKEPKPALDLLPALDPLFKSLEIDDWVDKRKHAGGRWIEMPIEITDATTWASEMKRYETDVGKTPALSTLNLQEPFLVYFKVSVVAGLILSSPWVFFQIWSFIAAGLYPHEKRYVNVFGPLSIFLFLAGVFICQFYVIPKAIEALLWFNEWLEYEPELRLNEWLSFAIFMPLVFGLSFQTPLVMLFLERIGVFSVETFRGKRRIAWFVMLVFAAIITPSPDAVSLMFLWVPMGLLYELGIIMCIMSGQRPKFDMDVPEPDEMVGV